MTSSKIQLIILKDSQDAGFSPSHVKGVPGSILRFQTVPWPRCISTPVLIRLLDYLKSLKLKCVFFLSFFFQFNILILLSFVSWNNSTLAVLSCHYTHIVYWYCSRKFSWCYCRCTQHNGLIPLRWIGKILLFLFLFIFFVFFFFHHCMF